MVSNGSRDAPLVFGARTGDDPVDIEAALREILEAINARAALAGKTRVLLKPNYVIAEDYRRGNTTNPKVIEILGCLLREMHPHLEITVGESGFIRSTAKAFKMHGLDEVARKNGFRLLDFTREKSVDVSIDGAVALTMPVGLAAPALEMDAIVSVPSLKTHSLATTTLSMKNFMGTIVGSAKSIMHSRIHDKIVDLYSFFKEKAVFGIIDGIIGSDGYECGGSPVHHGLLLGSRDLVALDTIGTMVMGIDPADCPYLGNAMARGLGIADPGRIVVKGIDMEAETRQYCP